MSIHELVFGKARSSGSSDSGSNSLGGLKLSFGLGEAFFPFSFLGPFGPDAILVARSSDSCLHVTSGN